jgi:hypothetical protein
LEQYASHGEQFNTPSSPGDPGKFNRVVDEFVHSLPKYLPPVASGVCIKRQIAAAVVQNRNSSRKA